MKIGATNHPRKDILKEIEWIGKNGFDFVDLFLEEDKAVPEKINVRKVKALLKKYKLGAVGHTAPYIPVGSGIKAIREAAVKEIIRYFKVFGKIGVKYVTVHANWAGGMFKPEEKINFQAESLKKLVKAAKRYKLKVIYEPINTWDDSLENTEKVLKKVPGLYFHLDIGHANMFGKKPEKIIRKLHKKMKHVHLHDNDGSKDQHLPMGCGRIDWKKTLKTLKKYYNDTITLEVYSLDKDYLLMTKDKLKKMWEEV